MTSKPKGLMLIINNMKFQDARRHKERNGSLVDEENLMRTFQALGFEVFIQRDLKSQVFRCRLFFCVCDIV